MATIWKEQRSPKIYSEGAALVRFLATVFSLHFVA